ncbi:unnamed protein product [Cunninghamella echinulata]
MYEDTKYIAISYRWGEYREQLVQTPDYISHITSLYIPDFKKICEYLSYEPDLNNIPYIWIDTISVDQHDHKRKKETILKMTEIYRRATYILAVPDLHLSYLWENPASRCYIRLIYKHKNTLYPHILETNTADKQRPKSLPSSDLLSNSNNIEKEQGQEEVRKAYEFLEYLIEDWSNRVWVISEYNIAKEKNDTLGTPLKYMFLSLLYVKKLTQRNHLEMVLTTKASRNEDRFYAILPSWSKHSHLMKNKNFMSDWNITDIISVRLKLYEISDLYDKIRLINACSYSHPTDTPTFPTFASSFYPHYVQCNDLYQPEHVHKDYSDTLLNYLLDKNDNQEYNKKYAMIKSKMPKLHMDNIIDIQLNSITLLIKANIYFIRKKKIIYNQEFLSTYSLENSCSLKYIFIPFFIHSISTYQHIVPDNASGIFLLGNININRWILCRSYDYTLCDYTSQSDNYIFRLY